MKLAGERGAEVAGRRGRSGAEAAETGAAAARVAAVVGDDGEAEEAASGEVRRCGGDAARRRRPPEPREAVALGRGHWEARAAVDGLVGARFGPPGLRRVRDGGGHVAARHWLRAAVGEIRTLSGSSGHVRCGGERFFLGLGGRESEI